jgi:hypothetical protein
MFDLFWFAEPGPGGGQPLMTGKGLLERDGVDEEIRRRLYRPVARVCSDSSFKDRPPGPSQTGAVGSESEAGCPALVTRF